MTSAEKFQHLLKLGAQASASGNIDLYLTYLSSAGTILNDLARSGNVDLAMRLEPAWYNTLVKKVETDQHYYLSFTGHAKTFWSTGEKTGGPLTSYKSKRERLAFIVHSGVLLGHTEVMLKVIANWREVSPSLEIFLISLNGLELKLRQRLERLRIPYAVAPESLPTSHMAGWTRKLVSENQIHSVIWLSTPCWVSFFFGYGLAKKQILWSLKFHAVHLGDTVKHIGMTKPTDQKEVLIHGNRWFAYSPPLSVPAIQSIKDANAARKLEWKGLLLFGTLAREEKFNSASFIQAIVAILKKCPDSHYLYTGRAPSVPLTQALHKHGLSAQSTFIGWVDTNDYAQILDVFLETFPFGCGVTGAQALAHGTRVISLWDEDTLPRFYFPSVAQAKKISKNWLIAETIDEFIGFATQTYQEFRETGLQKNSEGSILEQLDKHKSETLLRFILDDPPLEPS